MALGALVFVALASYWPTLMAFLGTWASSLSSYDGHGYFAAGLCIWLIWRDRSGLLACRGPGMPGLLPLTALLSIGWMLGVVMNAAVVHEALFVVILATWALATFGLESRGPVLSIGFTALLAVPMWGGLVPALQRATTVVSGGVTELVGIPVVVGYDTISLTSGTLLVEDGCAGLNYLMSGLVLGAFYAHLFLKGWRSKLEVVLLAAAVSIAANWIRVAMLVFIAEGTQMQSSLLRDHLWLGWVVFTLLMIPTYFLVRRIEKGEAGREPGAGPATRSSIEVDPQRTRRAVGATLVALVGPLLFMGVGAVPRGALPEQPLPDLEIPDSWTVSAAPRTSASDWIPEFEGIDGHVTWSLDRGPEHVELTSHYFVDQKQGEEMVQWGNRMAPDSLLLLERAVGPLAGSGRIVREAIFVTASGPRVVWYWYRVAGIDTAFPAKAKLLEIVSFFRRSAAAELVTLNAACNQEDCADARGALNSALGGGP